MITEGAVKELRELGYRFETVDEAIDAAIEAFGFGDRTEAVVYLTAGAVTDIEEMKIEQ